MRLRKKLIIIFVCLIIFSGLSAFISFGGWLGGSNAPTSQVTEDSLTRGLVGYWAFEEDSGQTAADLSGNGNTGTVSFKSS